MPLNNDQGLDKNYILALVLSMTILMGYPVLLNWLNPPSEQAQVKTEETRKETSSPMVSQVVQKTTGALSTPDGPFLEKAVPASLIQFENAQYQLKFSTLGGTITDLYYKGEEGREITQNSFYQGDPEIPGLFGMSFSNERAELTHTIFKLRSKDERAQAFEFVYEKPGEYRVVKQYSLNNAQPVIVLDVSIENLSPREKHFPIELQTGMNYELGEGHLPQEIQAVASADKIRTADVKKVSKKGFQVSEEVVWAGVIKKYFAVLARPNWKSIAIQSKADDKTIRSTLRMEPVSIAPGSQAQKQFLIYAGPQRYETLREFGFEDLLSRGFFGLFKIWLLMALKFLYGFVHNYGWAIIIMTLLIKAAFTPLTHMSFESMKKMQVIQPKLKSLQERYKDDPTKLNKEMMELYRRNKVNPMAGCLPMLLQIPVFIAFYQVLNEMIELNGTPFIFWINDLAQPDRLFQFPFTLPILGDGFNLLPILMLGSMVWQQKLTPQAGVNPEQAKIMAFMPVIFGFLFYKMPSGLVLYWFVNNMLSIVHQVFIKRIVVELHHEDRD